MTKGTHSMTRVRPFPRPQQRLRSLFALHSRYPVAKFLALTAYLETRSLFRKLWVVLTVPLPALLAAIVPVFLPLQAPHLGPNMAFFLHGACIVFSTSYGTLIHLASAASIPRAIFSHLEILAVSICCTTVDIALMSLIATYVAFPVPFLLVLGSLLWIPCLGVSLALVLRRKLWQNPIFHDAIQLCQASLNIQSLQVLIYPAISVLYDHVDTTAKAVIVIFFPGIKYVLKRLLYRYTERLGEGRSEQMVSGIEICASLYQSMIMQTMPSTFAMVFVLGVDVIMGFASIKLFLDRYAESLDVPRDQFFIEAARRLRHEPVTQVNVGTCSVVPLGCDKLFNERGASSSADNPNDKVVLAALGIADSAERILLIEYYEVMIPVVNSIFLLVAAQFPSAQYNPRLASLYHNPSQLRSSMQSIWLYSILQGLSYVAMHMVMQYRYGVSALSLLAFVLERHWYAIVGKMLPWLSIILHFTLVHYGTDFSFRFHFDGYN